MHAQVILPLALPSLTYEVPEGLLHSLDIGSPVIVPLKKKTYTGYIHEIKSAGEKLPYSIKPIIELAINAPKLDAKFIRFLQWVAEYYHYPLGEVLETAIPAPANIKMEKKYFLAEHAYSLSEEEEREFSKRGGKKRALIDYLKDNPGTNSIPKEFNSAFKFLKKAEFILTNQEQKKPNFLSISAFPNTKKISSLSDEQLRAYEEIQIGIKANTYHSYLLHGITGSGKTEVYLSAAEYCLLHQKSVLFLVPEISLTPQLFARVQARLGNEVAILHSSLTHREWHDQWNLIQEGRARVVLGVRSAIFSPLKNIGLIVVDEEHESAFKQEDRLRYNARDMAMLRAKHENCTVVLGSATPSLESYYQSIKGKIKLLRLSERFNANLPKMEIVDLKKEPSGTCISNRLLLLLKEVYNKKQQSILFLNRRGFSSYIQCKSCGDIPGCPNCSVSLTNYKSNSTLRCHYCNYEIATPLQCKHCSGIDFDFGTMGTELLEQEIKRNFPDARMIRIDRNSMSRPEKLSESLRAIANHEVDFVIGTQMIAKGHDFPNVALAAIVNADITLNIPDFRSQERGFQLFTQVSGRAGRSHIAGRVILQTFQPENIAIQCAEKNSYEEFCSQELDRRAMFHYPPYYRLARILLSDPSEQRLSTLAYKISTQLRNIAPNEVEIVGPAPAVLAKILNRYRWNILLKCKQAQTMNAVLKTVQPLWKKLHTTSTHISIDVDPISLL